TEFLLAVPLTQLSTEHGTEKINAEPSSFKRLIRNRRNISWYKQHSDFWNWYKFFTDSGNQQGVAELDRMYLAYLQNKNRAENQRSYKLYLQHLSEIYKSCADSEDPNCLASYLSRSKAKPEPQTPAPVRSCDPFRDPQCLQALGYSAYPYVASAKSAAPAPAPAPVKTPAYIRTPAVKDTSYGQYYYAPVAQSFLSPEQKAELLRICGADDVECLQYHFRGAYGYKPAGVPAPSYAHLGSSSQKVPKAPASLYRRYPNCDPRVDPNCAYVGVSAAQKSDTPAERFCNPLYDENCNPLTGIRYAGAATQSEDPKDDPASVAGTPQELQNSHYDPYSMFQDAAAASSAMRRLPSGSRQIPQHHLPPTMEENSQSFGPPGKTKEGYDCFIGYDEQCYPIGTQNVLNAVPQRQVPHSMETYEPHLNADGSRKGVIEPDPHCDPEYDSNCRLRRYEPEAEEPEMDVSHKNDREHQDHREEAAHPEDQREEVYPEQQPDMNNQGYDQQQYDRYMSGQEDPYASYDQPNQGSINFQDILKAYASRFPNQEHHRAYTGDYKKK
ncbi:actinodin1 precursor, partial [Silurus meridionalis]